MVAKRTAKHETKRKREKKQYHVYRVAQKESTTKLSKYRIKSY